MDNLISLFAFAGISVPVFWLALVLILVGLKMITADYFLVPTLVTLGVVGGVLLVSIAASIALPAKSQ